jgi:hypothetical protein
MTESGSTPVGVAAELGERLRELRERFDELRGRL